jgi:hypothetical protein
MADTLAILHWEVKIDAGDVEFVLGGKLPEIDAQKFVRSNHDGFPYWQLVWTFY